jgi:hypothetical protein
MMKNTLKGALIASAVASMFAVGGVAKAKGKDAKGSTVMCTGVNECKGKGACKGGEGGCKGKNECKGKGVVEAKTEKDCTDKGGKVAAAPAK